MTGLEKVIARIIADAEADAKKILAEADAECDAIRAQYDAATEAERARGETLTGPYVDSVPMKRRGTDEDIADAVLFFASSLSDYITGAYLSVSGGRVMPTI